MVCTLSRLGWVPCPLVGIASPGRVSSQLQQACVAVGYYDSPSVSIKLPEGSGCTLLISVPRDQGSAVTIQPTNI